MTVTVREHDRRLRGVCPPGVIAVVQFMPGHLASDGEGWWEVRDTPEPPVLGSWHREFKVSGEWAEQDIKEIAGRMLHRPVTLTPIGAEIRPSGGEWENVPAYGITPEGNDR